MNGKIIIASDIHGSAYWCEKLLAFFEKSGAEKLVLLGDLLYHGPRNPLPMGYDTMAVAGLLNGYKEKIVAVRGNCDSEVDQMVLQFPILADYALLPIGKKTLYLSHGHLPLPPLGESFIVVGGHTHFAERKQLDSGVTYLNDGSVSLPKEGKPNGCMLVEGNRLSWINLQTGEAFDTTEI